VVEASPPPVVVLPPVSVDDVDDSVVVVSTVVGVQAPSMRAHARIEARRRIKILRLSARNP
jgi:hypothetical protein